MGKVRIYECPGTGGFPRSTFVKDGASKTYFDYTLVTGYPNNIFPLDRSVAAGLARVLSLVDASPGPFVLVGTSQGAQIMSEAWRRLRAGSRAGDMVGVYLFGNPLRQAGRAFPGAKPVPAGHGIAPAALRLTDTTDLVWEFANPGDPVCTLGDSKADLAQTNLYKALMSDFSGALGDVPASLAAVWDLLDGMSAAHNAYALPSYKPVAGVDKPATRIVLDHLNGVVGPQHAPTAPEPAPATRRTHRRGRAAPGGR